MVGSISHLKFHITAEYVRLKVTKGWYFDIPISIIHRKKNYFYDIIAICFLNQIHNQIWWSRYNFATQYSIINQNKSKTNAEYLYTVTQNWQFYPEIIRKNKASFITWMVCRYVYFSNRKISCIKCQKYYITVENIIKYVIALSSSSII